MSDMRWRRVEEELPADGIHALVKTPKPWGPMTVAYRYRFGGDVEWRLAVPGGYCDYTDIDVTHWCPLPEPPEEKEKG